MTSRASHALIVAACSALLAREAAAQPDAAGSDAAALVPIDRSACARRDAPAEQPDAVMATPVTWSDFEIAGTLIDPAKTVRTLLAPTINRHRALTEDARTEIERAAASFGYHVVGIGTKETPAGTHAIVHLSPRPRVRSVSIEIELGVWRKLFTAVIDDEVRRRMKLRVGTYLAWDPRDRACELFEEQERIEDFLSDEGYFDARVTIAQRIDGVGVSLDVTVAPGAEYKADLDRIRIVGDDLAVTAAEIRAKFRHHGTCLFRQSLCYGSPRFDRTQHQLDIQKVVKLFHARGYPAVRVRSDFDPDRSFDRRSRTVRFTITIDQRRRLDIKFEGFRRGSLSTDTLHDQLTFNEAASVDDVEAHASAAAIAAYLQGRGYFDARVTWTRERFEQFDRIVFRIDQGRTRRVRAVAFLGNRAVPDRELRPVVGTKTPELSTSLLGGRTAATTALLADDVDRLVDLYHRKGYRDARVTVSAATDPAALGSAAMTAALLAAERGDGLYVRFDIAEGQPTLLTQVQVELGDEGDRIATPEQRELCTQALRALARLYEHEAIATPATPDRCIAVATNLLFREYDAAATRDELRDRLYSRGRARAQVEYEAVTLGPRRIAARYRLRNTEQLEIGKVVIRGAFRTRPWLIRDQLDLKEGDLLTKERLAEGARQLRNTALFDSVNISFPDLETTSAGRVNAVVEVTERYDYIVEVGAEGGYSSFNGAFVRLIPSLKNLFGTGISLDVAGTVGVDVGESVDEESVQLRQLSADSTLRIPQWLTRWSPVEFQTELTAFHRRQDTPRFGLLRTTGATLALSRTWERQRIGKRPARAITGGLHYDFRSRERNVDALRPIGADDDESQVPITTRTGSIGFTFEWEQRVDRLGNLSPLAPEAGFRFDGQLSLAAPQLLGQDTFVKVSAAGSKYWPVGSNLVLRADLRYDQGFPLGGAALLPEVERFFAGGDSTVRGYDDERLATEVVLVGVPPLDNVRQIRILPAGGNIRVLGSLDAQLRIYKIVATALFVDAGLIKNQWSTVELEDIRPSVGMALVRLVTPFGAFAFERAIPLRPRLGDDPRGRWHISFAARAQF